MGSITELPEQPFFDVEQVLSRLSIDEKIALLSGSDPWHTAPVKRLGVPKIRLTDGPNGVRGTKFFNGVPAACLPCGTALAATWDTKLIRMGGMLQGDEAIAKGASVILGPTTNMQRSPLGGRGFESFSEDPVLAGQISAATVNGIQSTGVAATIKHYVCNDQEHERQSVNSVVSERALREIYLMPFQIAERDSRPRAYMTSYNKVNGTHVSSSTRLIQEILRREWGFQGLVMSDWFGTYSIVDSIKAGLDLEMPGPTYIRGALVKHALGSGRLIERDINNRVRQILKFIQETLPLGIPEDAPELTIDTPSTSARLREIASSSIVLLKNDNGLLPLSKTKRTAVIGPNAAFAAYCGGGSAALPPYYAISPLQGVRDALHDSTVEYELGAPGWKKLPLLSQVVRRADGKHGMDVKAFLHHPKKIQESPVDTFAVSTTDVFLADYSNPNIESNLFFLDCTACFTPDETDIYDFSLSVSGTGKLYIDGEMIIDNITHQTPGDSFFGSGTIEEMGSIELQKGTTYQVRIVFGTLPTRTFTVAGATAFGAGGFRAGCHRRINMATSLERAVSLAKRVDQVILCVGLNSDWESEGYDRTHMDLPAGSDDLIEAVTNANPNTVVVIQSGTPVTMPWRDNVPAILQAWYGGNETGNAIADIIFGAINPSAKLPLTFPIRNEDNPAFLNFRSENGNTVYGEGIWIGYRFYEKTKRSVAFPFGFGMSYTTFTFDSLIVKDGVLELEVSLDVRNTGCCDGAEVVQVYIAPPPSSKVSRPVKELKGFTKAFLCAGQTKRVVVRVARKYAVSYWDEQVDAWCQEAGRYEVLVGNSSDHTPVSGSFEVVETTWWNGL